MKNLLSKFRQNTLIVGCNKDSIKHLPRYFFKSTFKDNPQFKFSIINKTKLSKKIKINNH